MSFTGFPRIWTRFPIANLTGKQQAFVDAYVGESRFNATDAAREAGYSDPETSAMDNLKNEKVLEAIQKRLEPYQLGRDEVLAEVSFVALARDDEWINASDKVKALQMLMKFHKLYEERVSHSFEGDAAEELKEMLGLGHGD